MSVLCVDRGGGSELVVLFVDLAIQIRRMQPAMREIETDLENNKCRFFD